MMGIFCYGLHAQETPIADIDRTAPAKEVFDDDGSRVAVLGYHVFHKTLSATQMRIPTSKFRSQMEAIRKSNIAVITLEQFLAWRRGEGELPPQSILITMDDGWRSVYTEAFPIMKELKLPFTIFLYKNYVGSNRGGRALSLSMIREMVLSKLCTIGSHSVSHPFPSKIKKAAKEGPEAYEKFLRNELGNSKKFLDDTFKVKVNTYAYPGGYYTNEMFPLAEELGYDQLFTVKPGKIRRNSPRHTLPRYIVLGNHDTAFNAAMVFRNGARVTAIPISLPHPTKPEPGEIIASRLPDIEIDLSSVEDLDPESVVMRVAGFGKVPLAPNTKSLIYKWTVSRPLRQPLCEVTTQWRLKGNESYEPVIRWSFRIDHEAAYQAQ
jgi:peptidoglycan/xylan/chitin deacetylase (PgdA/CDA1 family)